jgi:hypothetical protein
MLHDDWGQCTWHVFNRRAAIGKGISTYWWNANNWDNDVKIPGLALKFISETKILPLLLTRSTNAT